MKLSFKNEMWVDDYELFAKMKDNYLSEKEREFFEKIFYKRQWECTIARDMLLLENDNEDKIYILRINCSEYIVGSAYNAKDEVHVMCLSEALNLNLKEIGAMDEDITLFQWLRQRNYAGINYENDHDYI